MTIATGAELLHPCDAGKAGSALRWSGVARLDPDELARAATDGWLETIEGWYVEAPDLGLTLPPDVHAVDREPGTLRFLPKPNLVVAAGRDRIAQRAYALPTAGTMPAAVDSMGVDNGTTAPRAADTTSAGAGTSGSTSRRIQAFDAAATYSAGTGVVTSLGTFTNANVAFAMRRLFLAAGTADAAGSLVAMTGVFTIDYTTGGFSAWAHTFQALHTFTGS